MQICQPYGIKSEVLWIIWKLLFDLGCENSMISNFVNLLDLFWNLNLFKITSIFSIPKVNFRRTLNPWYLPFAKTLSFNFGYNCQIKNERTYSIICEQISSEKEKCFTLHIWECRCAKEVVCYNTPSTETLPRDLCSTENHLESTWNLRVQRVIWKQKNFHIKVNYDKRIRNLSH